MQKSATVAIIKDKKLLLLLRGSTAPYNPNKYGFPGGMLEDNESLEDCVLRELFEETGIQASRDQLESLLLKYQSGHKRLLFVIKDDTIDSNVTISWEHSEYIWVSYSDCYDKPLVPGVEVAIKTLTDLGYLM